MVPCAVARENIPGGRGIAPRRCRKVVAELATFEADSTALERGRWGSAWPFRGETDDLRPEGRTICAICVAAGASVFRRAAPVRDEAGICWACTWGVEMGVGTGVGKRGRIRSAVVYGAALACATSGAAQERCPDVPPGPAFRKESLTASKALSEPVEMAVARDGRVFVAERRGAIRLYDPGTKALTTAGMLDVYINPGAFDVGGILGVAVGPRFPADNWVYAYYAPKSLWNGKANAQAGRMVNRLSRFRFAGGVLDTASEQVLFDVPSTWETHNGGSLKFGKDGDLYLSTGDNSCASCNDQFSPMDERPGREYADDQRSTANTNDLRGKILRIRPLSAQAGGRWYSIPEGNLFPEGTAKTRPEIFTMGHRNPYRIFPDPVTGRLFIGEFGPASHAASDRGPAGADQIKITDSAAFLGYPYFLKDNQPYCHWDYALGRCTDIKGQAGPKYDPMRPINTSPNNTGLEVLPPARPAMLWEHDGPSPDPVAGLKACGFGVGPVYHFDPALDSKSKFPPWFEGKLLFFGIGAGWQPKLAVIPPGPLVPPIKQVIAAPWTSNGIAFSSGVHDMEYGPGDGALYVLDYGNAFYSENGDAGLFRIAYTGCLPAVSLARRIGGGARPDFLLLQEQGSRRIPVPDGALGAEVHSLAGKKLWSIHFPRGSAESLQTPTRLGSGVLRLRWIRGRP
jgi:cytochrome c